MQTTNTESSFIKAVAHEPKAKTVAIEFTNGTVSVYGDVNYGTFRALVGAKSVGRYYNLKIKPVKPLIGQFKIG